MNSVGQVFAEGCDVGKVKKYDVWDYFCMMLPPKCLRLWVGETNRQLGKHNFAPTTFHEAVKFLGILLLITRFEFGSRRDLWSAFRRSNYIPAANLGKTGISKNRFDQLLKCWRWSHQPEQ